MSRTPDDSATRPPKDKPRRPAAGNKEPGKPAGADTQRSEASEQRDPTQVLQQRIEDSIGAAGAGPAS